VGIGKYVSSRTFSGGGCDWNIRLNPDGCCRLYPNGCWMKGLADCVSIYLCFLGGGSAAPRRTKFSLSLLDKDRNSG
jgi:speckle-type POZ protein